jgi:hypothetical protein
MSDAYQGQDRTWQFVQWKLTLSETKSMRFDQSTIESIHSDSCPMNSKRLVFSVLFSMQSNIIIRNHNKSELLMRIASFCHFFHFYHQSSFSLSCRSVSIIVPFFVVVVVVVVFFCFFCFFLYIDSKQTEANGKRKREREREDSLKRTFNDRLLELLDTTISNKWRTVYLLVERIDSFFLVESQQTESYRDELERVNLSLTNIIRNRSRLVTWRAVVIVVV